MSLDRRELVAGMICACCCTSEASAQWPNGEQSSTDAPPRAAELEGCMIGRLSDISYTMWGERADERTVDAVFDLASGYLEVFDGTVVVFDGPDSANALATPQNLMFDIGDGTVLIGRRLIQSQKDAFGSRWLVAIATSLAHETAHLAQYMNHLNLPKRTAELHADFLAGWTLQRFGLRPDRRQYSDASVAKQSLRLMQRANSAIHGSAGDRTRAFDLGWQYGATHPADENELKQVPLTEGLRLLGA